MSRTGNDDVIWASPSRRALLIGLALLVEGLILTLRFDTQSLVQLRDHYWWGRPLAYVSEVPRFAIAFGTVLLLASRKLSTLLHRANNEQPIQNENRVWMFVLLHVVALGSFAVLTKQVLEGGSPDAVSRWVLPWLITSLLTVLFILPVIVSPRALWIFGRGAAPVLLLSLVAGLAAWMAGHATETGLSRPLQSLTSGAVFRVVSLFRSDAFYNPADFVVGTPRFEVEIAPTCSGYEGMGLIVVFLSVFLWSQRASLRFPAAFLLLPLGALVASLANVTRLALLVLLGEVAPTMAKGGFHSYAGAVLFSAIAVAIAYGAQHVAPFAAAAKPKPSAPQSSEGRPPSRAAPAALSTSNADAFLAPFLVFLGTQLLTGLFRVDIVDPLYLARVLTAIGALWYFRKPVAIAFRAERSSFDVDVAAPMIGLVVAALWLLVTPYNAERSRALVTAAATRAPMVVVVGWLLLRALGSVVLVPIIEELAFRGYLMRRLASRDFENVDYRALWLWPIAISSLVFGIMHSQIIAGVIAGVGFALAVRRRGRLRDGVIAHATSNAVLIVYAVVTGRWSAWL